MNRERRKAVAARILAGYLALFGAALLASLEGAQDKRLTHALAVILAIVGVVIYAMGCAAWAEAKGYSVSVAILLLVVGALCFVVFTLILPPIVLFALEDKTKGRPHHAKPQKRRRTFTPAQHYARAVGSLSIGVTMGTISAFASYFDWISITYLGRVGNGLIVLAALPIVGWGCSHLARYRGYTGGLAYALLLIGFGISNNLVIGPVPELVEFMFLFAELLPITVLLALPKKRPIVQWDHSVPVHEDAKTGSATDISATE
jgi:hypothetical protein